MGGADGGQEAVSNMDNNVTLENPAGITTLELGRLLKVCNFKRRLKNEMQLLYIIGRGLLYIPGVVCTQPSGARWPPRTLSLCTLYSNI